MTKLKGLLLLLVGALVVDFAVENALLSPTLKLFRFELGKLPIFLIVYGCLIIGFVGGWLGHALKRKRQKRAALSSAEKAESRQASQEQQQ